MDGNSSDCCLLCGEQLDGNGDVASPNSCAHVFHLICIKNWADIKINAGHPVTCPLQSCLKSFQSIGVKKNSKTMKVVNVVPVDQDWSCPICLNSMSQVNEIGNPEVCNHHFCLKCLLEWSQTNTSCPLDRMEFRIIFVKNAVGGAIQRRVRTPQRDLRAELTDGESEDTEDDVEVTVATAVSNSLVVAANELMRNRILNPTCPQCQLVAGPEAVVCSACQSAFHRQCARVRDARVDQWRCLRCRFQAPPAAQRGDRRAANSPLTRVRRNAIVFNEWHGEFLQLIGNRNYHSSDDDTYSYDTERANADAASDDSIDSLTSESEVSLPSPSRNIEALLRSPNHASASDSDEDDSSRPVSASESGDIDSDDSDDTRREPRRTRQTDRGAPTPLRPPSEPVNPLPLRHDLFSRFSDSDESDNSFHPSMAGRRERSRSNSSSSDSVNTDTDVDERDGRHSRASHRSSRQASSVSSHSSRASRASAATPSRGSDSSDDDFLEPPPRLRPCRRRARWDSDDSEEEEEERRGPKRLRLTEWTASRSEATTKASRPRRQAAPVDLAEPSFDDSFEEPRSSSTGRHRAAQNLDRPTSSSSRGGGGSSRNRGAAAVASRRPAASTSGSNAASRRTTSSSASRRGAASSSGAARPSSSGTTRRPTAGPSRSSRAANSGSARTSGKRKKKGKKVRRKSSTKKRKSSVKMRGGGPEGLRSSTEEEESDAGSSSEGTDPALGNGRSTHWSPAHPPRRRPSHRQLRDWFEAYSDNDSSTTAMTDSSSVSSSASTHAISDSSDSNDSSTC